MITIELYWAAIRQELPSKIAKKEPELTESDGRDQFFWVRRTPNMTNDDKLGQDDSDTIRYLTRNRKVASKSVPKVMALCRDLLSHEDLGKLAATMGRGMTTEDRYGVVMALVGGMLAPEEGDKSMREAFEEMMSWTGEGD